LFLHPIVQYFQLIPHLTIFGWPFPSSLPVYHRWCARTVALRTTTSMRPSPHCAMRTAPRTSKTNPRLMRTPRCVMCNEWLNTWVMLCPDLVFGVSVCSHWCLYSYLFWMIFLCVLVCAEWPLMVTRLISPVPFLAILPSSHNSYCCCPCFFPSPTCVCIGCDASWVPGSDQSTPWPAGRHSARCDDSGRRHGESGFSFISLYDFFGCYVQCFFVCCFLCTVRVSGFNPALSKPK